MKYAEIEKQFNVIYPENNNATYTSLLNFSDDLNKPFQRWYRYKEGFSVELVQQLIREYSKNKCGVIMDPFLGSGSTLLAASYLGYSGIGFEVNPFSYFLAKCKLSSYSVEDSLEFKMQYEKIVDPIYLSGVEYTLPKLSISKNVFNEEIEKYYMSVGKLIDDYDQPGSKVGDLLKLGWLACLESLCNYRKAGNGLKKRKYIKPRIITVDDARHMLIDEYEKIYNDITNINLNPNVEIYNESCLNISERVCEGSIEGIIFSPPYANCFDYTEIYKLELWFGNFVTEYSDLKKLRETSLHSHLNISLSADAEPASEILESLLDELDGKALWDKKIPKMLKLYYNDMFSVLDKCYESLCIGGFCCIVVGNSSYGGVIFPADLILADYAKQIGFSVDKIEVDRYIITSSQQYEATKDFGKYLRESVLCLIKNE